MAKSEIIADSRAGSTKNRSDVIANERQWHEQEAHRRYGLDALLYSSPAFDNLIRYSLDFLAGQPDELILDMGCGEGKETWLLAKRGLRTVSMDLSHKQLCRARDGVRAAAPEAAVFFVQANAEEPPFAAGGFRLIYGKAILHHLDLETSSTIIQRLLKPGGKASFAEPLDRHPLFWLGRRLTPKLRTINECPLLLAELEAFANAFPNHEMQTFFLLTPLTYFFRLFHGGGKLFQKAYSFSAKVDSLLFARWQSLGNWAWYGIINIQK